MEPRYWPFDVLPAEERTPQHHEQIAFLEAAHAEGFRCCLFGAENFGAEAGDRTAFIVDRAREYWELVLEDPTEGTLSLNVGGFPPAAEAALRWLRGESGGDVIEFARPELVPAEERPGGYIWEEPATP